MRLSSVAAGDIVLVRDRRDARYFALVERRDGRTLHVLPFNGRAPAQVTAYRVIGYYKRRGGDLDAVRAVVARCRVRHGVKHDQAFVESVRLWEQVPA